MSNLNNNAINEQINDPVVHIALAHPFGGEAIAISLRDLEKYNNDPDGYAAKHFGLTRDEYKEWIELDGKPRCGAQTRAGQFCKSALSGMMGDSREWLGIHRQEYCRSHSEIKR